MVESDKPPVKRRTVLQSAGAAAGTSALLTTGTQGVFASKRRENYGERHFIELQLRHTDVPDFPIGYNDSFREYVIDEEERELLLSPVVYRHIRTVFRQNDTIVRGGRYEAPPTQTYGIAEKDYLRLGRDVRLDLEQEYVAPEVLVEVDTNDRAVVTTEGTEAVVAPGETGELTTEVRSVDVREFNDEFEEAFDERIGEETTGRVRGPVRSVDVTPVIDVRNYGTLDVSKAIRIEGDQQ